MSACIGLSLPRECTCTAAHVLCRPTSLLQRDSVRSRPTVRFKVYYFTAGLLRQGGSAVWVQFGQTLSAGWFSRGDTGRERRHVATRLRTSTRVYAKDYTSARLHVSLFKAPILSTCSRNISGRQTIKIIYFIMQYMGFIK